MTVPKHILASLRQNGIEIVNLAAQTASVRMRAPFVTESIEASENLQNHLRRVSQWSYRNSTNRNDNFNFDANSDTLPKDEEFITVKFRALSKTIVPGHWIDWSKDNVLKDSVPKMFGVPVFPNHDFSDIHNALGAVSSVVWDEEGKNSEGVPGINAEDKIDALMNPRIARLLLMKPPGIRSTSMTVLFRFEPSHPEIWNESRWRFIELLGEEIEGGIVRLIVTEILEYWEKSLVFLGADYLAKKHDDDEDEDLENLSAANLSAPTNSKNEEKKMKIPKDKQIELGIEFAGEEVSETTLLQAAQSLVEKNKKFEGVDLEDLQKKAKATDTLMNNQRAEVTRLAKIAELGSSEGELDEIVSQQIADADADALVKLEKYYEKKAAQRFPTGRSSVEDTQEVHGAGGVNTAQQGSTVPTNGLL